MSDQSEAPARLDRVVVGVDGSEQSERALDRAVLEARTRESELEILCGAGWPRRSAVPVTESDNERLLKGAADIVDRAVERAKATAPDLRVVPHVHSKATAADAIVEATATAALTVVGTRGRGGFAGLLVGSVSLRAAAHCRGPLMVVGNERAPGEERARATTLVGVRSETDHDAVRYGFEDAERAGSVLRVMHAWTRPPMPPNIPVPPRETAEASRAAKELVLEVVEPLRGKFPHVKVRGSEQGGAPAATLIEASRAADMVVLTTKRRRQRRLGMQLSPVVHAVLHHAHCPVVLVPSE